MDRVFNRSAMARVENNPGIFDVADDPGTSDHIHIPCAMVLRLTKIERYVDSGQV